MLVCGVAVRPGGVGGKNRMEAVSGEASVGPGVSVALGLNSFTKASWRRCT